MSEHNDEEDMMNSPVCLIPATSVASTTTNASAGPSQSLSKNALKRAEKRARMEAFKPVKRAAEKAKRRERAAALREGYEAGTLSVEEQDIFEKRKALRTARKRDTGKSKRDWKGGIVIDLGFDELMTEQEINSMTSQLAFVYAANRTAPRPFSTILHTSFGPTVSPQLWGKMKGRSWEKWTRSYWNEGGIESFVEDVSRHASGLAGDAPFALEPSKRAVGADEADLEAFVAGPIIPPTFNPKTHRIVYLSADAEEELSTLSEDEIYVIGGIVDRNRHKMLCQNKGEKMGIRTARLPIGSYLANLHTRKVLTVNQVFEILSQYVATNDWAAAFEAVVPQRKYGKPGESLDPPSVESGPDVDEGDTVVAEETGAETSESLVNDNSTTLLSI